MQEANEISAYHSFNGKVVVPMP